MTTPTERTRAVLELTNAVSRLSPYAHGKSAACLVPRELLRELRGWMQHYPTPSDIEATALACPHLWASADAEATADDVSLYGHAFERGRCAGVRAALEEIRNRIKDHPVYAELTEAEEMEIGGDTAEFSYLARVADEALGGDGRAT